MYFRESQNWLEDLINNNLKNSKQITLEIDILHFDIKIIRAGGIMNKYENKNFFDFFCPVFKKKQICEMKKVLFNNYSDNDSQINSKYNKNKMRKEKVENQYYNFTFIIEEKEQNEIFCKLLKMKLSFILLRHINNKIYLNGIYILDHDIIVGEQIKKEEIILFFGNKEQKNCIKEEFDNKHIYINKKRNEKYLGNKKLAKVYNYLGCKKYNVYHVLSSNKKQFNTNFNKSKEMIDILEDENSENSNKIFIYNDLASQTSSRTRSMSSNNLVFYNRGNKKTQNNNNITKEINIIKYILFFSFFLFLVIIICEDLLLKTNFRNLEKDSNLYLVFQSFYYTYYSVFFSVLSLGCVANSTKSLACRQYMGEVINLVIDNCFKKLIENNDMDKEKLKSHFIDFVELIFYQSQIFSDNLDEIYNNFSLFIIKYNNKKIIKLFQNRIEHYKINQNIINNKLHLNLAKENITFSELNLLTVSRLSIITNNINNFKQPIYLLNKTGEETFNNIYGEEKLTSYQENIYLLILDHNIFADNIILVLNDIVYNMIDSKKNIKKIIYFLLNMNLFLFLIIIIVVILYLFIYYIIILKNLRQIFHDLKEKIDEITLKDILRNKIDNLKLMLNFYENDISKIIEKLNHIYNGYKENCKQKIKEESKLLKKEGIMENKKENDKIHYIRLLKGIKKLELAEYSGRKKLYSYTLLIIIIIFILIYIIIFLNWFFFFIEEEKIDDWNGISEEANGSTHNLLNSYIMMIYYNQTIEDISFHLGEDYISFIYSRIAALYKLNNYKNYIKDFLIVNEMTMIYECSEFYENLENDLFIKLKTKFKGEESKFFYTMWYFCEWSNIMMFNNFKSIYLQFYNMIKIEMENFSNNKYSDIIDFFGKYNVLQNEIIYLILFIYIMNIMYENVRSCVLLITSKTSYNIMITMSTFFIDFFFMIIIVFLVYVRNINKDCKRFIKIRKIFKVCKINE